MYILLQNASKIKFYNKTNKIKFFVPASSYLYMDFTLIKTPEYATAYLGQFYCFTEALLIIRVIIFHSMIKYWINLFY